MPEVGLAPKADIDLLDYSITLVASTSIEDEIARPSAFAVLRLIANSNLVATAPEGCRASHL